MDEFDFQKAVWSIPAERMKMRRPHKVSLSKQVMALIEELDAVSGQGRYLFPSFRTVTRPMSENAVNGALLQAGGLRIRRCLFHAIDGGECRLKEVDIDSCGVV